MKFKLADEAGDGSIEVWTANMSIKLMEIPSARIADLCDAKMVRGEPDYKEVATHVADVIWAKLDMEDHDTGFQEMYEAILRFISPGPPYEDDDVSFGL